MLRLIGICLCVLLSRQEGMLTVTKDQVQVFKLPLKETQSYNVEFNEETVVVNYPSERTTIGIELTSKDDPDLKVCYPVQHDVIFANYYGKESEVFPRVANNLTYSTQDFDDPHINDPTYFLSNPILTNMVHIQNGFAVVSSDHRLLVFNISASNKSKTGYNVEKILETTFDFLRPEAYEHVVPQLVYDAKFDNLFIIYQQQIITGKIQSIFADLRNLTSVLQGVSNDRAYVGNVRISDGYLFVPIGNDGLDIYLIWKSGELEFKKTLDAIDIYGVAEQKIYITDVAIGGEKGQYLFILDRLNGVTLFDISGQTGQAYKFTRVFEFGMVPVRYGNLIKEYKNQNLFILCSKGRSTYVEEIAINVKPMQWFRLRTHYLNGKYFDIDVTENIAILRGVDAHRVIYHSIWEGFQKTESETYSDSEKRERNQRLDEEYLYIPRLQSLEFFSKDFGFGDPKTWHYGIKHTYLFGITTHNIVELPYYLINPHIRCKGDRRWHINQDFHYKLLINSTSCFMKTQMQMGDPIVRQNPALSMCQYTEDFSVHIVSSQNKFSTEQLFSIIVGLSLMLIVLAIILANLYKRFRQKKDTLTAEISGFESKGYQVDPATTASAEL